MAEANDAVLDTYLRRAVLAAAVLMSGDSPEDRAGAAEMAAFALAVGLALQPDGPLEGTPLPEIVLDGLDAMHATAHLLDESEIMPVGAYANELIAGLTQGARTSVQIIRAARDGMN